MTERLERSVLLVPASNWKMIQKTAAATADAVCIDLEDAVAPDEKEASRAHVIQAFTELDFGNKLKLFRMNGLDTHFAYRDLIEIVEAAGHQVDLIVVPKVNRPEDIVVVETLLSQIESYKGIQRPIGLEALIETAAGCVNIREIAACSERLRGLSSAPAITPLPCKCRWSPSGNLDEHDAVYPGHRWHYVMHAIAAPRGPIKSGPSTVRLPASRSRKACSRRAKLAGRWASMASGASIPVRWIPPIRPLFPPRSSWNGRRGCCMNTKSRCWKRQRDQRQRQDD
ncbi:MAG: aldolase/citrate lyase family protein [Candidatus Competibacteraceae bacterium]